MAWSYLNPVQVDEIASTAVSFLVIGVGECTIIRSVLWKNLNRRGSRAALNGARVD